MATKIGNGSTSIWEAIPIEPKSKTSCQISKLSGETPKKVSNLCYVWNNKGMLRKQKNGNICQWSRPASDGIVHLPKRAPPMKIKPRKQAEVSEAEVFADLTTAILTKNEKMKNVLGQIKALIESVGEIV